MRTRLILILILFQVSALAESTQVRFRYGSQVISNRFDESLDKLVKYLNENPELNLEIQGHSDFSGSEELNQLTSQGRAKAVYDYFLRKGISKHRMSYEGLGSKEPLNTDTTEEARAENRRTYVECIIRKAPIYMDRKSYLSFRYSILNRESDDREVDSNIISSSYSHWLNNQWAIFFMGGLVTSQLNSNNSNSDVKGWLFGAGASYDFGKGLSLSGAIFYQKDKADISVQSTSTLTGSSDSSRFGMSVNIAKSFALKSRWLISSSLNLTFGDTQLDILNTDDSKSLLRISPKFSVDYLLSKYFRLNAMTSYHYSNREITLSNKKTFTRAGVGVHYTLKDVSYYLKLAKDFSSNQNGRVIGLGMTRSF